MSKFPEWLENTHRYRETDDFNCYRITGETREVVPPVRINYKNSAMPDEMFKKHREEIIRTIPDYVHVAN
ncbi:hypothetical protein [Veillonella sp. CAG:933]|jgi:hypothetical protein|uniref:hypothetical protein n=1 Tax=Veillonella sp. CAG:933 TaxID=1262980 RepID=UPI0003408155|nr:hypothetical protein [Veillonella sp. CAG:933]CCX53210.1 unknown [Veillonella sp. CAG:933]